MQIAAIEQHPLFDMKPESLETAAVGFASMASTIRDNGGAIVSAWQPIGTHYRGPGDAQLFDAMTPVGTTSTMVGDDLDKAASAMRTFKVAADLVKIKMDQLKVDHAALAVKIGNHEPTPIYAPPSPATSYGQYSAPSSWSPGGSSYSGSSYPGQTPDSGPIGYENENWWDDEALRNENLRIIRELSNCLEQMHEAERVAINAIRGLNCMVPITSGAGGWDSGQYGVDQIADDAETPWGTASFDDESCGSATVGALGGLGKDIANITNVIGLGWGWDGTDLGFSGDNLSETWGGIGALIGRNPETGEFSLGYAGDTWGSGLKSIVAWDRWAENPGAAFGESVVGVGSLLIPGAGVVAKGGKASKLANVADGGHVDLPNLDSFGPRVPDLDGRMPDFDNSDFDFDLDGRDFDFDSIPSGGTDVTPDATRGDTDTSPTDPAGSDPDALDRADRDRPETERDPNHGAGTAGDGAIPANPTGAVADPSWSNTRKGEFGEAQADAYVSNLGYGRIDTPSGSVHNNGIDGIYRRGDEYVITEAKYGSSRLGNTADGRQMSTDWILGETAQGPRLSSLPLEEQTGVLRALQSGELSPVLLKVSQSGEVTPRLLDEDGYVIRGETGLTLE